MLARRYRGLIIAVAVALVLACGGIAVLGIPGAVIFELTLRLVYRVDPLEVIPSDSAWPIALYITLLWPISIVLAHLIAYRVFRRLHAVVKLGIALVIVIASCLMLSALFYSLA